MNSFSLHKPFVVLVLFAQLAKHHEAISVWSLVNPCKELLFQVDFENSCCSRLMIVVFKSEYVLMHGVVIILLSS
jgi:hypothetical protein